MGKIKSPFEGKPQARILDATAANRMIWKTKESDKVIWIDIEPELEITPDLTLDCTKTQFPDKSIFTIFFDPPHFWGQKKGKNFFTCRNMKESKKFLSKYGMKRRGIPTYYGTDKYSSKTQLLSFIHKAQKEFLRILSDNGILWLKWCELKIPIGKILVFFKDWDEMLRLEIGSKKQTLGVAQNYWVMLMKKDVISHQVELSNFNQDVL